MCCPFGNKLVVVALVISDHIYDGVMSPFNLCMALSSTYLFKLEFCRINKSCRNVVEPNICEWSNFRRPGKNVFIIHLHCTSKVRGLYTVLLVFKFTSQCPSRKLLTEPSKPYKNARKHRTKKFLASSSKYHVVILFYLW